jgi:hypothetical protein
MEERLLNPQQELFLAEYINPKSPNFGNAVQSALKAGYTESYANNITGLMPDWLSENIGDMKRLRKAEKVLDTTLDLPAVNEEGKVDTSLLTIQNKTAQFFAERLNKEKYSSRSEIGGPNGKDLPSPIINVFPNNSHIEDNESI